MLTHQDTDLVSQPGAHGDGLGLAEGERRSLRANLLWNPSDQSRVEGMESLGELRTLPTVGLDSVVWREWKWNLLVFKELKI